MKIETKFNIGDPVFYMNGNKVIQSTIHNVHVETYDGEVVILYDLFPPNDEMKLREDENSVFKTIEDLFEHLKKTQIVDTE